MKKIVIKRFYLGSFNDEIKASNKYQKELNKILGE